MKDPNRPPGHGPNEANMTQNDKHPHLVKELEGFHAAVIAFSGGTDSSLLAYTASRVLDEVLAVIASSPTQPGGELEAALDFCRSHGIPVRTIEYSELDNMEFVKNDPDRCYHCKLGLFREMERIREGLGYDAVFDGSTMDDLDDHRPGSKAASELGVVSPLQDAGLSKGDIRSLSKALGLVTWDKPQLACLSSRIQTGQPIDAGLLAAIDQAEAALKGMGYRDVRVRVHGETARIEIGRGEDIALERIRDVLPLLKRRFKYVTLDLEGYRTGSMNECLARHRP